MARGREPRSHAAVAQAPRGAPLSTALPRGAQVLLRGRNIIVDIFTGIKINREEGQSRSRPSCLSLTPFTHRVPKAHLLTAPAPRFCRSPATRGPDFARLGAAGARRQAPADSSHCPCVSDPQSRTRRPVVTSSRAVSRTQTAFDGWWPQTRKYRQAISSTEAMRAAHRQALGRTRLLCPERRHGWW